MSKPRHAGRGLRRLRIGPLSVLASALVLSPLAAGADGDLDPAFGTGGKVVTDLGADERADSAAIQADGKIVVVASGGVVGRSSDIDFLIVRYRSDGSLDPSFGSAGWVYTDLGGQDWVGGVVIQPDGKIVAAGNAERTVESDDFGVVRYNANGTLDESFGEGGKLRTQVGVGNSDVSTIALQGNGKIVVAGLASSGSDGNDDLALVRYNRDGSLDLSFGAGGKVLTALTSRDDRMLGIAVDADGKVVAGAVPGTPRTPDDAVLARYNRDGSLDKTFGSAGKVTYHGVGDLVGLTLQPDGRIVLFGKSLLRYRRNGDFDRSFGDGGRVQLGFQARAVAVQRDGKIVAAGPRSLWPWPPDSVVMRFKANGDTDGSFGETGRTTIDLTSDPEDYSSSVSIQSDGKIVVAGETYTYPDVAVSVPDGHCSRPCNLDIALVRLLSRAPKCVVPNVRGRRLAVARTALARRSCAVGRVRRKASTRVKKGRVISQSRRPGTRLPNRTKVNLVVSSGRT